MNIKRAFIALAAMILLPAAALAQVSPAPGTAVFITNKFFVDENNKTAVTVNLDCDSGLPLHQDDEVTWELGWETAFVLGDIPLGELAPDCTVSEKAVAGYDTRYVCSKGPIGRPSFDSYEAAKQWGSATPCGWDAVEAGDVYYALIVNTPKPVEVAVTKTWVVERDGGLPVDESVKLEIYCDAYILGEASDDVGADHKKGHYTAHIDGTDTVTIEVMPNYPSSECWATEDVRNSAVETTSTCGDKKDPGMTISAGHGDSCEITNTVFYEGIPTLSQYGLAIMALLMLGVGFVGFRRFV